MTAALREKTLMKEVWVPCDQPFHFSESVNPKTGEHKFILEGLMMPFGKISRNNVLYNVESVKEKHKNLIGKPVMYNHLVEGDALPKGHYIDSFCEADGWHYKADIDPMEKELIRKLERGDLRHVSIQLVGGRVVERFDESGNTYTEAFVSDIIEGSIVPAPGFLDTTASFAEAFKKKEDMTVATGGGAVATKLPQKDDEEEEERADPMHPLLDTDDEKLAEYFVEQLGEEAVSEVIRENHV
jgi:hypothetical protein